MPLKKFYICHAGQRRGFVTNQEKNAFQVQVVFWLTSFIFLNSYWNFGTKASLNTIPKNTSSQGLAKVLPGTTSPLILSYFVLPFVSSLIFVFSFSFWKYSKLKRSPQNLCRIKLRSALSNLSQTSSYLDQHQHHFNFQAILPESTNFATENTSMLYKLMDQYC